MEFRTRTLLLAALLSVGPAAALGQTVVFDAAAATATSNAAIPATSRLRRNRPNVQVRRTTGVSAMVQAEIAVVEVRAGGWTPLPTQNRYRSPVAACTPQYGPDSPPYIVRMKRVEGSTLQVRLARLDREAASSSETAPVHCFIVEQGVYTESVHGVKMEAAVFESTTADQADSWLGETRAYSNSYEQPVVIGQVMSSNSETPSMFWARGLSADEPPSATMLRVGRHAGEGETAVSGNETIGYIVIEQSVGVLGALRYQAGVGPAVVSTLAGPNGYFYPLSLNADAVTAVLAPAGMKDTDGGWPVLADLRPFEGSKLRLAFDEDALGDSERQHGNEQVAFLAFALSAIDPPKGPTPGGDPVPTASLSVFPSAATLSPGETLQFQAVGSGIDAAAVRWTLASSAGSVSPSGLYTAPLAVESPLVVSLVAAQGSLTATAQITLRPNITLSVAPQQVTLGPSGTQQFAAAVSGTSDQRVAWSLSPPIGSISAAGLYTAPADISSVPAGNRTVSVQAVSVADPNATQMATLTLIPAPVVSIQIAPGVVGLAPGESTQFSASGSDGSSPAVNWSLTPPIGTISATGLYTAPSNVDTRTNVSIKATSSVDSQISASATVNLLPSPQITLQLTPRLGRTDEWRQNRKVRTYSRRREIRHHAVVQYSPRPGVCR